MKKNTNLILSNWKQVCVVVFAGLLICSVTVQSQPSLVGKDVRQTYYFAAPILETIDIAGILYDRVTLDDCYSAGSAGEPKIPSKGVFLLLPPDSLVSDIELITGEKVLLGSGYSIEPTSEAIPLSQTEDIP